MSTFHFWSNSHCPLASHCAHWEGSSPQLWLLISRGAASPVRDSPENTQKAFSGMCWKRLVSSQQNQPLKRSFFLSQEATTRKLCLLRLLSLTHPCFTFCFTGPALLSWSDTWGPCRFLPPVLSLKQLTRYQFCSFKNSGNKTLH